ncbi:hypothetical protein FRB91_004531 [Serendipita sp. 411]|nr:hypothetical protein FRB91_004531 [Serendipita sp. 411]
MRVRPRWIFAESLLLGLFLIPSMREAIVAPIAADYSQSDSQEGHGKLNTFMGRLLDAGHSIDDIASFTSIVQATPGLPHIQTGISAALVGLCCFPLNPLISSGFGLVVGAAHYLLRIGRPLDQGLSTQDWRKTEPFTIAELEALYDKRLEEEKERWIARENFRKSSIEGATDGKPSIIEHSKKSVAQVSSKEGRYDESLLLKRLNLERELRKTNWEMVHCREDLITIQKALATQI